MARSPQVDHQNLSMVNKKRMKTLTIEELNNPKRKTTEMESIELAKDKAVHKRERTLVIPKLEKANSNNLDLNQKVTGRSAKEYHSLVKQRKSSRKEANPDKVSALKPPTQAKPVTKGSFLHHSQSFTSLIVTPSGKADFQSKRQTT